jgi:hypothetical protein
MSTTFPLPARLPARLFRAMREDDAGKPRCGTEANVLGVRPGEIELDVQGLVAGGRGGLSVTPDDPQRLPPHVRPPKFLGGRGKLPVFELSIESLGAKLSYRPDPKRPTDHGFVEPGVQMQLADYNAALAATQSAWRRFQ